MVSPVPPTTRSARCPNCRRVHSVPALLQGSIWDVCLTCLDAESDRYAGRMSQGPVSPGPRGTHQGGLELAGYDHEWQDVEYELTCLP